MAKERKLKEIVSARRVHDLLIDMHCHPAMKPYGHSFRHGKQNSPKPHESHSIWYYDPPDPIDKLLNYLPPNLTKFRQSDFTSLSRGGVNVICASLYPLEKGFVLNEAGRGITGDALQNLITGIGDKRIDHLQAMRDYFTDLEDEYNFYLQLNGQEVQTAQGAYRYKMVKDFAELQQLIHHEPRSIGVVMSIEGAHALNTGLGEYVPNWQLNKQEVFDKLEQVKAWEYKPFFITFAHHFNNDLCGHAKSLGSVAGGAADQSFRMGEGFTPFGYELVDRMLDISKGRIHIDIKHMSMASRRDYYQYLDSNWTSENIPLLVSHGAANGMHDHMNNYAVFKETAPLLRAQDINFYDTELVRIARSGGLFCLQLDERRIASNAALRRASARISRRKIIFHRSRLVWNNIQHMAEVLNAQDLFPWGHIAIGSDYDGIINPLNGFWTAEDMLQLDNALLMHAYNYLESPGCPIKKHFIIDPEEVVNRVMGDNALSFMERFFH